MKRRHKRFYALPLALAALSPIAACAAGRGGLNELPAPAAGSPTGVVGSFTYADVLRPKGRARGDAAEQVATRACDRGNSANIGGPAFDACMLERGWRFDSFEPMAAGAYLYGDVLKPHRQERSDDLRQAATQACDAGDSERIGTPRFDACMRARGWRFAGRVPEAPSLDFSSSEPSPPAETTADDSARQAIEMVNQQMAIDAANAAAAQQQWLNQNAIQQYENSFIQQELCAPARWVL
jgi:hypothetical protein